MSVNLLTDEIFDYYSKHFNKLEYSMIFLASIPAIFYVIAPNLLDPITIVTFTIFISILTPFILFNYLLVSIKHFFHDFFISLTKLCSRRKSRYILNGFLYNISVVYKTFKIAILTAITAILYIAPKYIHYTNTFIELIVYALALPILLTSIVVNIIFPEISPITSVKALGNFDLYERIYYRDKLLVSVFAYVVSAQYFLAESIQKLGLEVTKIVLLTLPITLSILTYLVFSNSLKISLIVRKIQPLIYLLPIFYSTIPLIFLVRIFENFNATSLSLPIVSDPSLFTALILFIPGFIFAIKTMQFFSSDLLKEVVGGEIYNIDIFVEFISFTNRYFLKPFITLSSITVLALYFLGDGIENFLTFINLLNQNIYLAPYLYILPIISLTLSSKSVLKVAKEDYLRRVEECKKRVERKKRKKKVAKKVEKKVEKKVLEEEEIRDYLDEFEKIFSSEVA